MHNIAWHIGSLALALAQISDREVGMTRSTFPVDAPYLMTSDNVQEFFL